MPSKHDAEAGDARTRLRTESHGADAPRRIDQQPLSARIGDQPEL